jgi:hypothetical protein
MNDQHIDLDELLEDLSPEERAEIRRMIRETAE